jgi:hypothetical protein
VWGEGNEATLASPNGRQCVLEPINELGLDGIGSSREPQQPAPAQI